MVRLVPVYDKRTECGSANGWMFADFGIRVGKDGVAWLFELKALFFFLLQSEWRE